MLLLNIEKSKNEDEDKNIVNTQAPFHQVCADILECKRVTSFEPRKAEISKRQRDPENSLQQCFPDGN